MKEKRVTHEELQDIFGTHLPMEAVQVLQEDHENAEACRATLLAIRDARDEARAKECVHFAADDVPLITGGVYPLKRYPRPSGDGDDNVGPLVNLYYPGKVFPVLAMWIVHEHSTGFWEVTPRSGGCSPVYDEPIGFTLLHNPVENKS